ncbi:MAG TPA: pilus assembly protein PilM [Pirellulaceae bacterium]|nr:pilus assembly protein PilM [Pirellulaceae bacterium]
MFKWLPTRRYSPIGIDVGARSVKLVQLTGDRSRLVDAARVELPTAEESTTPEQQAERISAAVAKGLAGRSFHGREAVVCLSDKLFLQNVRVPKQQGEAFDRQVAQEASRRLPYSVEDAEIRFIEASDVRQGDSVLREVIVFACQRSELQQALNVCERARLRPVAVDVEPAALARSYAGQYRREEDRQGRALVVQIGYSRTAAMIAQGDELLFVKYIDIGGQHLDAAVARHLSMNLPEAVSLRRHNGDRRADMQDPEIARSVALATRPVLEKLASELAMCVRYHSVTFRGQPLVRLVLGGGEATPPLLEALGKQLDLPCELSDPFRTFPTVPNLGRKGQWDVAAGLAMRSLN